MAVLAALKSTNENAKTLYSHTSPLYRKTGGFCSEERMERVPLKEALIRRIYDEPEATALVMYHVYGRDNSAAYLKRNGFQRTGEQK